MPGLAQSLGAAQQQRQTQETTLSLQARQRLRLLPLPLPELRAELRREAEQNPFLEYEEPLHGAVSLDGLAEREAESADESENLDYFNASLEGFGDQADPEVQAEAARRHDWLIETQTEAETLYRHLERQVLRQMEAGPRRDLVLLVCDALDADGYLREDAHTLLGDWWQANEGRPPEAFSETDVEAAIKTVQGLDPVGVGARSLAECLALQTRADPRHLPDRALYLRLCDRLGSLLTTSRERLARDLRCTPEELTGALTYLRSLNPFPGRAFAPNEPLESPEIVALREPDGHWRAVCDERRFPLFRVDEAAIEAARAAVRTRDERACVNTLVEQARLAADAYHERNDTLRLVAQTAFDRQTAFLDSGGDPATLRPLLQKEVAEAIGYDKSIVSRVVRDKAVRVATSRKLLPLAAFFTHAVASEGEEAISDQQAKGALKALVAAEDPAHPLSDQALAEALAKQGIPMARRTVAKYREQLGIASTRERRRTPPQGV